MNHQLFCYCLGAYFYLFNFKDTPPFKGTVSRDNLYSIFFIHHILLVLLEVLYEDFKFR
jgi:hypothetical protein